MIKEDHALIGSLALEHIFNAANEAIVLDGYFSIALSGGSIPNILFSGLRNSCAGRVRTDFTKWRIVFADERCVSLDDKDSSYKAFIPLFTELNVPTDSILLIDNESAMKGDVAKAAVRYNERFLQLVPNGSVHMVLLGMGPDGHTASLFPTFVHDVTDQAITGTYYMPVFASPKPPPLRITMTLGTINKAQQVLFIITGEAKAELLSNFLLEMETDSSSHMKDTYTCRYTENTEIPASKLCLHSASETNSNINLYLDKAAASKLLINLCV